MGRVRNVTVGLSLAGSIGCGQGDSPEVGPKPTEDRSELTWCDVEPILVAKCQRCHDESPKNGAPFSLTRFEDTQEPAPTTSEPERVRFEAMQAAIESQLMPPVALSLTPRVEALDCDERETLLAWLAEDTPESDENPDCEDTSGRMLECADE